MEIWRGASLINGEQIVVIATFDSHNRATGNQIQIWLLNATMNPLDAAYKTNGERAICGDCKHRAKTCYVAIHTAPSQIYRSWLRGIYPIGLDLRRFAGRSVRFGAYGDMTAAPIWIIRDILSVTDKHTGYTHQWKTGRVQPYRQYLMASVDSAAEYMEAKALGWRCYRVKKETDDKIPGELTCPKSVEAGHTTNCVFCNWCDGTGGRVKKDIVINVHGPSFKKDRFSLL